MAEEKPKIIVDDDWKAQARAEKQKLAQQVEASQAAAKPAAPVEEAPAEPGPARQTRQIPPANFTSLISSLVTQIIVALGGYQNPEDGHVRVDLDMAKHHIDTLAMLEEKTKGNLTPDETKLLDQALYEVRMHYVQVAQSMTRI